MMNKINVANLSLNQLTYAVGLAEAKKGIYTMDPRRAGFSDSLTQKARNQFVEAYPQLDCSPAPQFLDDRAGELYLWGPGEWLSGTWDDEHNTPHIGHGPGGKFNPLKNGVNILEREKITTTPGRRGVDDGWTAWSIHSEDDESEGETLLEAGLRCYVRSVYGEFVNLPNHVE
jgi:hypothetical protein